MYKVLSSLLLLFLVAMVVTSIRPVLCEKIEVDAITGSIRGTDHWIGGHHSVKVEESPLANRLTSCGIAWTRDWRTINDNDYYALGMNVVRGCSLAPPIYSVRPVLDQYAKAAGVDELRKFVPLMEHGTSAQRDGAIHNIEVRVLER